MCDGHEDCAYARAYTVEFRGLREDLKEVKARVNGLETTLARGVLLLVANLAGVIVSLARALW
jgi:hypothetical protein